MFRKGSLVVIGVTAILAAFSVGSSFAGNSYVARMGIITFQSTTLTDQEILSGKKDGTLVTLAGELRLPPLEALACQP